MNNSNWIRVQDSYHISNPQPRSRREENRRRSYDRSLRNPPREFSNHVWRVDQDSSSRRRSMSPSRGTWVMQVPNRGRPSFNQRYNRMGRSQDTGAMCGEDVCALV